MSTQIPYVGPRSLEAGEPFHGRTKEVSTLTHRFLAQRIMLLYSPSGAGKSSLINAGLLPILKEQYGFELHTTVRVHLVPEVETDNRYVYSTIASLEADEPGGLDLGPERIATLTLDDYLKLRITDEDSLHVIVFDQFEELMSANAFDTRKKREFIVQVGKAIENQQLYVLFAMREEYLGAFDAYRQLLPTRLAEKFRLGLLGHQAALEAIAEPARNARPPREFASGAAPLVLENLVRSDVDGQEYPYVEPLHLQVLCLRIWQQTEQARTIKRNDIRREGGIRQALSQYYGKEVCRAALRAINEADKPGPGQPSFLEGRREVSEELWCGSNGEELPQQLRHVERQLRSWIATMLITPDGDRRMTRTTPKFDGADRSLEYLREAHIVTSEPRPTKLWHELSHDRLVAAVRDSNRKWDERNLDRFQRRVADWYAAGAIEQALPTGEELTRLEALAAGLELTDDEQRFLEKCRVEDKHRRDRNRLRIIIGATLVFFLIFAGVQWWFANQDKRRAQQSEALARSAEFAGEARAVEDPNLALILAVEAAEAAEVIEADSGIGARSALHQASGGRLLKALRIGGTPLVADLLVADAGGRLLLQQGEGGLISVDDPMNDDLVVERRADESTYDALSLGTDTSAGVEANRLAVIRSGSVTEALLDTAGIDVAVLADQVVVLLDDGTLSVHPRDSAPHSIALKKPISAIAVSSDGLLVVGNEAGGVSVLSSGTLEAMPLTATRTGANEDSVQTPVVALAADATTVAAAHSAGPVELIDRETGETRAIIPLGEPATGVVITEAGSVAVASRDGTVRLLEAAGGNDLFTISLSHGPVTGIASLPGDRLAIATPDVAVNVWDVSTGHLPGQALGVVAEPDGTVLSAGSDGRVLRWSLEARGVGDAVPVFESTEEIQPVLDLERRADGLLAIAVADRVELRRPSHLEIVTLDHDATVRELDIMPTTGDIVTASDSGVLTRWNDVGEVVASTTLTEVEVLDLVAGDTRAVILAADGSMWVWDLTANTPPGEVILQDGLAQSTSLGAVDGSVLIGTAEGQVLIFEERSFVDTINRALNYLGPGLAAVSAIAASQDPTGLVAFAMTDGTTEVWEQDDAGAWSLSERIPGRSRALAVDIAPERDAIVAATIDGRIVVYPLNAELVHDIALEKLGRDPTERECDRFKLESEWCNG